MVQRAMITEVVQISANLENSPLQSSHCIYWRKIIFNAAHSRNLAASKDDKMTQQIIPLRTQIFIAAIVAFATVGVLNNLNQYLKNVFPQVPVVLSIQVNRSYSRYITSMATLLLR